MPKYRLLKIVASEFGFCLIGLCAATLAQAAAIPQQEYDTVIRAARNGHASASIEKLQAWHRAYPQDQKIIDDLVVVLGWAGEFNTALTFYDQLILVPAPTYALNSIGYSALAVQRWADAEKAYRLALRASPDNIESRTGLVDALLGQQRSDEALRYVQAYLPKFSSAYTRNDIPMIMLLAHVYASRDEALLAANTYQEVLRLAPQSPAALRGYVFALDAAGLPYLAARNASRHPELFSAEEQRQIAHAAAARTVNFGQAQLTVDYRQPRFATTDAALNENKNVSQHFGDKPMTAFDRMVALRDRQRMTEVVQLYQSLLASGTDIPPYAKAAAADAYLYLEQPETARDLYLAAIKDAGGGDVADTDNWRTGLAYAYSEAEQHDEAQAVADQLVQTVPPFSNRGIASIEAPNEDYPSAPVLAALMRLYADRLQEAETRLASLRQNAPFNSQVRLAWADLQMARGHPRAALNEYSLLLVDDPKSVDAQVGRGNAWLALDQFTQAKQILPPLVNDYPENKGVQNFARQVGIYDRPVLQITSVYGHGGGFAGAESLLDAQLYSAPLTNSLGDPYRVFTHISYAGGSINPGQPGDHDVYRIRSGVGIDYRIRDLTVSAEIDQATENAERSGAAVTVAKDFSDAWHARVQVDSNVNDLAASAFGNDITAYRVLAGVTWQKNESRSVDAELSTTDFSDDNRRDAAALNWTERWISGPVFKLDSIASLAASQNSARNTPYFNPESDQEASVAFNADWKTWRRYRRSMTQKFQVFGGSYWQQGFGNGATSGASYGHEWSLDDEFTLAYGIGVNTHPYDGVREKRTYGYLNLIWAIK